MTSLTKTPFLTRVEIQEHGFLLSQTPKLGQFPRCIKSRKALRVTSDLLCRTAVKAALENMYGQGISRYQWCPLFLSSSMAEHLAVNQDDRGPNPRGGAADGCVVPMASEGPKLGSIPSAIHESALFQSTTMASGPVSDAEISRFKS